MTRDYIHKKYIREFQHRSIKRLKQKRKEEKDERNQIIEAYDRAMRGVI